MNKKVEREKIKAIILSMIPHSRVILFGSQSRVDAREQSDYDLLVITRENFTSVEKRTLLSALNKTLVQSLNAPFDILMNSETEVVAKQLLPGHIIRTALKEGVAL